MNIVVNQLVGQWAGSGNGAFPTLETFSYRERLDVSEHDVGVVHYLQQTWRLSGGGEVGSHVETGFIAIHDDSTVEMLNAQGADRVEVLDGRWSVDGETVSLELRSAALAHDDRMISSWRNITVSDGKFSYDMGMATTAVPKGATHLTGMLQRR